MFEEFKKLVESCYCPDYLLYGYGYLDVIREGKRETIDPDSFSYTVEVIDSWGGEDKGVHIGAVYKLTDKDTGEWTYAGVYGSYYSYDGAYFEGVAEVEPFEKTVTRYKKKGS